MAEVIEELKRGLFEHLQDNLSPVIKGMDVVIDYGQGINVNELNLWIEFVEEGLRLGGVATRGSLKRYDGEFQINCYYRGDNLYVCSALAGEVLSVFEYKQIWTSNYIINTYDGSIETISKEGGLEQKAVTVDFIIRRK